MKSWINALTAVKYVTRARELVFAWEENCPELPNVVSEFYLNQTISLCFLSNTSLQTWGKNKLQALDIKISFRFFLDTVK